MNKKSIYDIFIIGENIKNNKGFATSFMLFSLLVLFLLVLSSFMLTMNNSTTLNSKIKDRLLENIEEIDRSSIDQLIVYYDGIENGNIDGYWQDLSNNNNNGKLFGATHYNNYHYFDGDDYITINELNTSKITYEVIFKVEEFADSNIILSNYNNGGCGLTEVVNDDKNVIKGSCIINEEEKSVYSSEITEGTLYDIALTYDKKVLKIYVNGILSNSLEVNNSITYPENGTKMTIGSNVNNNNSYFKGNIYDVKIYRGALSAKQIENNYTNNTNRYNKSVFTFSYTGKEEEFVVPETGVYQLETWGAQGGTVKSKYTGGYGGYSTGKIKLNRGDILYINVGESGKEASSTNGQSTQGSYNGGGGNTASQWGTGATGGGATHIAKTSGLLSSLEENKDSIIIVAGGGGGGGSQYNEIAYIYGGSGGGYIGGSSSVVDNENRYTSLSGATQTEGYSFGQGGSSTSWIGAGGGGYYGGYSSDYSSNPIKFGGTGGSGYIGNSALMNKAMYCYNCDESSARKTKTISTTGTSSERDKNNCSDGYSEDAVSKCAKKGNGYALITKVDESEYTEEYEEEYAYTGTYQTFTAPVTGEYTIELWGASGAGISQCTWSGCTKDKENISTGAYTKGVISLNQGEKLYLYVGQQGYSGFDSNKIAYNGGGSFTTPYEDGNNFGGGGATDVRLVNNNWDDAESLASRIMVAAGGGGVVYPVTTPGYAGALSSMTAVGPSTSTSLATQLTGYSFGTGMSGLRSGGGGGYYGGYATDYAATGGSSYISGHLGSIAITSASDLTQRTDSTGSTCSIEGALTDSKCSEHYSKKVFTNTVMKSGNDSMPKIDGSGNETGHSGNGYAKISWSQESKSYVKDELVLYYDGLNTGNSNSTWKDLSENKNDGIITNSEFSGNHLSLSGSSSGVVSSNTINYNTTATYEIVASTTSSNAMFIDARTDSQIGCQPLYIASTIQVYCSSSDAKELNYGVDKSEIHKYNVVYTSDKTILYVDGVKKDETTIVKGMSFSSNLFVGRRYTNTLNMSGNVYAVRVYNKALSEDEIQQNYQYDYDRFF